MTLVTPTVLVVEDHLVTRTFLLDNLAADGFDALGAGSLDDARRLLRSSTPAVVVLDLGLPDGDGLDLLRQIRDGRTSALRCSADVPVLVLSTRSRELDRLRGFERGCDDYLPKPFSYHELRARLRALLRRASAVRAVETLSVGALEVDVAGHSASVDGRSLRLSKKEYGLLRTLAAEPERVFTREDLLRTVWGYQTPCRTRTLDSHAVRLRRKLAEAGEQMVVNVWGVGYRLIDVEER